MSKTLNTVSAGPYHHDLNGHLSLCETNFWRLKRLVPGMREGSGSDIRIAGQLTRIEVLENAAYTSTLRLTQAALALYGAGVNQLELRVYHDAKMAEVVRASGLRGFAGRYDYPNPQMFQPDEKEQINRFLAEWLAHCLSFGEGTEPISLDGAVVGR